MRVFFSNAWRLRKLKKKKTLLSQLYGPKIEEKVEENERVGMGEEAKKTKEAKAKEEVVKEGSEEKKKKKKRTEDVEKSKKKQGKGGNGVSKDEEVKIGKDSTPDVWSFKAKGVRHRQTIQVIRCGP